MKKISLAEALVVIGLAAITAMVTAGIRLSAVETKTLRNEQDIHELRLEIKEELKSLHSEVQNANVTLTSIENKLTAVDSQQKVLHRLP